MDGRHLHSALVALVMVAAVLVVGAPSSDATSGWADPEPASEHLTSTNASEAPVLLRRGPVRAAAVEPGALEVVAAPADLGSLPDPSAPPSVVDRSSDRTTRGPPAD